MMSDHCVQGCDSSASAWNMRCRFVHAMGLPVEESKLKEVFSEECDRYRTRVRRWLLRLNRNQCVPGACYARFDRVLGRPAVVGSIRQQLRHKGLASLGRLFSR